MERKKPAEWRAEIVLPAVVLWVARQGSRVITITSTQSVCDLLFVFLFLTEFLIEAVNFGAHLFKYFSFINADASFGEVEFLGNIGVGDFLGDVFKYVAFIFV